MNKPKISIIIPVYNVEQYIAKCLNSLCKQTLQDIEIICINDGSTDNSLKILQEFASNDSRIILLNQSNKGQSAARNLGISQAHGEYLGFVDSDDWVDLDYFEKLYYTAKKYDCDIACAGFKRCGRFLKSKRKSFKKVQVYTEIKDIVKLDNLPEHNYIWNKIYKRSEWDFTFQEGRYFEDMALLIKILYKMKSFVTVPETYYNYRKNPTSTVALKTLKHKQDFKWAKGELYGFAGEIGLELKSNKNYAKRVVVKIFGITICKVYYYELTAKLKLFGFLTVLSWTRGE